MVPWGSARRGSRMGVMNLAVSCLLRMIRNCREADVETALATNIADDRTRSILSFVQHRFWAKPMTQEILQLTSRCPGRSTSSATSWDLRETRVMAWVRFKRPQSNSSVSEPRTTGPPKVEGRSVPRVACRCALAQWLPRYLFVSVARLILYFSSVHLGDDLQNAPSTSSMT